PLQAHRPDMHVAVAPHWWPHPPQLLLSWLVHVPEHRSWSVVQVTPLSASWWSSPPESTIPQSPIDPASLPLPESPPLAPVMVAAMPPAESLGLEPSCPGAIWSPPPPESVREPVGLASKSPRSDVHPENRRTRAANDPQATLVEESIRTD